MANPFTIKIDFFGSARDLDPCSRAGLYGFVLIGYFVTFVVAFCISLELLTAPQAGLLVRYLSLACALYVSAHLFLEARSTSKLTKTRWLVFATGIAELAYACWTEIHDPVAKRVFLVMILIGGSHLLGAKLVMEFRTRLNSLPLGVRCVVLFLGWSGILVPASIGIITHLP